MFLIDNTVLSNFALVGELNLLQDYSKGKGAITDDIDMLASQLALQGMIVE